MATAEKLLTVEEYMEIPDTGIPTELVQGVVVEMNVPMYPHGRVCFEIAVLLGRFLEDHPVGRATSNDSGVVTTRDPDTVRGPDVAYYSFDRLPKGARVSGYPGVAPDVVFEVRSPSEAWSELMARCAEYFRAGVSVVCVVEVTKRSAYDYRDREELQVFGPTDTLRIAEIHPDFEISLEQLFERVES